MQAYEGKAVTFDQTVLVDQERATGLRGCRRVLAKCYDHNKEKINNVVDSWTVKEAD